jgi:putative endonuclease
MKTAYVYMLASHSRVLYVGVTTDLRLRVAQHRAGSLGGFTAKYSLKRLVYFEAHDSIRAAIAREKQIKGWRREKKIRLIEQTNLGWLDLAASWAR